jgi:hypothetical protein
MRNFASDIPSTKSRGSELTWKTRFHVKATTSRARRRRDAASSATRPRTHHVAFERLVRIVSVVCCFSFSTPAGE